MGSDKTTLRDVRTLPRVSWQRQSYQRSVRCSIKIKWRHAYTAVEWERQREMERQSKRETDRHPWLFLLPQTEVRERESLGNVVPEIQSQTSTDQRWRWLMVGFLGKDFLALNPSTLLSSWVVLSKLYITSFGFGLFIHKEERGKERQTDRWVEEEEVGVEFGGQE